MKSLLALVLAVTLLTFTGNLLAEEKVYVPIENEELYATWVNEKYDAPQSGRAKHARWDYKSDGTWASYYKTGNDNPAWMGKYSIAEKWTDDKGDVWYKVSFRNETAHVDCYALVCISDSGSTMESAHSLTTHPEKIDRDLPFYYYAGIHYRK
jgi:hypothetical protein